MFEYVVTKIPLNQVGSATQILNTLGKKGFMIDASFQVSGTDAVCILSRSMSDEEPEVVKRIKRARGGEVSVT